MSADPVPGPARRVADALGDVLVLGLFLLSAIVTNLAEHKWGPLKPLQALTVYVIEVTTLVASIIYCGQLLWHRTPLHHLWNLKGFDRFRKSKPGDGDDDDPGSPSPATPPVAPSPSTPPAPALSPPPAKPQVDLGYLNAANASRGSALSLPTASVWTRFRRALLGGLLVGAVATAIHGASLPSSDSTYSRATGQVVLVALLAIAIVGLTLRPVRHMAIRVFYPIISVNDATAAVFEWSNKQSSFRSDRHSSFLYHYDALEPAVGPTMLQMLAVKHLPYPFRHRRIVSPSTHVYVTFAVSLAASDDPKAAELGLKMLTTMQTSPQFRDMKYDDRVLVAVQTVMTKDRLARLNVHGLAVTGKEGDGDP